MQFQDYYNVLGITRTATEAEIKKAYREQARKYHPDVNKAGDAEERFKAVNEAYQVLSDPEKRAKYDQFGADWERYQAAPDGAGADFGQWFSQAGGHPGNVRFEYRTSGGDGFSDFFETLFGEGRTTGRRRARSPRKGDDREHTVEIPLREAFSGTTRLFEIQSTDPCSNCRGTGIVNGDLCYTCEGAGSVGRKSKLEVSIPAGIRDGQRVRVAGKGSPGTDGGQPGDVFLRVRIKPDSDFTLEGNDLRTEVDVPLYTAILGGEAVVKTLSSKVALTIPPETQNGKVFRLRGQGWPVKSGSKERGDLLARVRVVLPTSLSEREHELFEELRALRTAAENATAA